MLMKRTNRRPAPRPTPRSAAELVLDLEARAPGEAEADFEVPGCEWALLVQFARGEHGDAPRSPSVAATEAVFAQRDAAELAELRESLRATKAALEQQRGALAHVLGAGVDTEFADCLEIARGYRQALDAERAEHEALLRARDEAQEQCSKFAVERDVRRHALAREVGWGALNSFEDLLQVVRGHVMALDAERARAQSAEDAAHGLAAEPEPQEEPEHPECPHCRETDGHAPEDCANAGWAKPTPAELAADSGRRLNGAGWKRHAKAARETNSLDVCHHCGAGDQIAIDMESSKGDDVLPTAMLCAGCRERLRFHPDEWERRHGPTMVESLTRAETEASAKKPRGKRKAGQVTLDEAVAAAAAPKPRAPGRATRKFPKGGSDPTEKCTQCGAELGEHDGSKCPRAALRGGSGFIKDTEPSAEAPF